MGRGKEKLIALLLSGLVFPGSGQLYLKRKAKGALIIIGSSLFVLYPLVKYLIGLNAVLSSGSETDPLSIYENIMAMETVYAAQRHTIYVCSLFLLVLWLFGIVDILIKKGEKNEPMQSR